MEKSYLKHVLVLLDHDEIRGIDFDQAVSDVFQELHRESSRAPAREQVHSFMSILLYQPCSEKHIFSTPRFFESVRQAETSTM